MIWDRISLPVAAQQLVEVAERCVLRPYRDSTGRPTIGWGSITMPNGTAVTMGSGAITQDAADALLAQQQQAELEVVAAAVLVPIDESIVAALVDFSHNLGLHALAGSTMASMLAAGQADLAADQLGAWVLAGGRIELGLMRRREMERQVWLGADVAAAYRAAWAMTEAQLMPAYHKALADEASWRRSAR